MRIAGTIRSCNQSHRVLAGRNSSFGPFFQRRSGMPVQSRQPIAPASPQTHPDRNDRGRPIAPRLRLASSTYPTPLRGLSDCRSSSRAEDLTCAPPSTRAAALKAGSIDREYWGSRIPCIRAGISNVRMPAPKRG